MLRNRVRAALFTTILSSVLATALPQNALAHRSGCHNLHTCPSDSKSYVCGDLGYLCNGATSIENIDPATINVPLLTENAFQETFGRRPTEAESTYWKKRFRADKESIYQIRRTMAWHAAKGSFGPPKSRSLPPGIAELAKKINALFRLVYEGRNPSVTENQYWLTRLTDKPSEEALRGAMAHHRARNIQH